VTGAPPTITITLSRIPAFSSALMLALEVSKAGVDPCQRRRQVSTAVARVVAWFDLKVTVAINSDERPRRLKIQLE